MRLPKSDSHKCKAKKAIPNMMIVVMVDERAYNGEIGKKFQHFNLNKIALCRQGRNIPDQLLTPNFTKDTYLRNYVQTTRATNYYNIHDRNSIITLQWASGYTIYAFGLTSKNLQE